MARGAGTDDVRRGLAKCLTEHVDWPPTLPQFLELCRPRQHPAMLRLVEDLPMSREERQARKATGAKRLAQLRKRMEANDECEESENAQEGRQDGDAADV